MIYCLYAIDRLSLGKTDHDMNASISLCHLFSLKVFALVGGHLPWNLCTFPRKGYEFLYPQTFEDLADGLIKSGGKLRDAISEASNFLIFLI